MVDISDDERQVDVTCLAGEDGDEKHVIVDDE